MRKKPYTIFIIIILLTSTLVSVSAKDVALRGMLRSYTGITLSEADLATNEQTLDLTLEGWGDMTRLVVNPYAYIGVDREPEIGLREAYVDVFLDQMDIRVGKQAVMWGQAEGAFITDIVSPRDMRSFILADFREIRKGIPAVKADYYLGSYTFEGIWIPQFVPASLPETDSIWQRDVPFPSTATIHPPEIPEVNLENTEIFAKISYFGPKISWELMGGYTWTDEPYVSSMTGGPPPTDIYQEYGRYAVAGGSFSTAIQSVVIRGETAAAINKPFTVMGTAVPVEKHHQIQTLIGLDWSLLGMEMSAQYLLAYVPDHTEGMMEQGHEVAPVDHTVTFRVQNTFFADRLTAKLFIYGELDPLNALIRPSLSWAVEDGVLFETGVELFVGDAEGTFGAYSDNSLAYVSLRWYF